MSEYQRVIADLRLAYGNKQAEQRDHDGKEAWKVAERQEFLALLRREGKKTLLEVGAGTGTDSLFFQEQGLEVVCSDLSPAMVRLCREKGLQAYEKDFLSLDFPSASFDAIYALNCLLHVPTGDLPSVLQKLRDMLRPGGLFFLGVYGGFEYEGWHKDDGHDRPRFFAWHTNEFMRDAVAPYFEVLSFKVIPLQERQQHFQSMILQRRED